MLEDPTAGRQAAQRGLQQRSNRVFILEYSPERSKSKKQKQAEPVRQSKEKLSSFLTRRDILHEESPGEELSHRRNIDRLTSLMSRARSSRQANDGQSGCEKLVKAIQKIIKIKNPLKEGIQALKKYTMLCSSNNYELFIQSKHYFLKDKRSEALSPPPLSPLASINQKQSFDEGRNSFEASMFSPKKDILSSDVTFRQKPQDPRSPLQESILHGLDSPLKYFSPLKASKESIPTAETLRSVAHLPSIMPRQSIPLPRFRNSKPCLVNVNEPALTFKGKKEEQFTHLYHLQSDSFTKDDALPEETADQIQKLLLSVVSEIKSSPKTSIFNKSKLDFALPTPIAPVNTNTKINIKYVSQAVPIDMQKGNESFKKRRNQVLLSAKQIADRMLFGVEVPAVPQKQLTAQKPQQAAQPRGRKRVSSLPRITFTYSSRDKDWRSPVPSAKCLPQSPKAQAVRTMLQAASPRKKEDLHSTFGSTQMAVDSSNSRNSRMRSPQQVQSMARVIRREPSAHNPFASRPIPPPAKPQPPKIDSEYYGFAQKQPIIPQRQLRPRMVTQQVVASSNQIEYVGIEQQPRGCCWAKERSRSLNERVLVGMVRPAF